MLRKDEVVPADIVILDTSLPKDRGNVCWVDTQSIEGFSTYALRRAVQATRSKL